MANLAKLCFAFTTLATVASAMKTAVFVGMTGFGKSHLGNAVCGTEIFKSSGASTSTTKELQFCDVVFEGTTWRWWDTPGFLDTDISAAQTQEVLRELSEKASDGVDAFLLPMPCPLSGPGRKLTEDVQQTLQQMESVFRRQVFDHVVWVLNPCRQEAAQVLVHVQEQWPQHIRDLMAKGMVLTASDHDVKPQAKVEDGMAMRRMATTLRSKRAVPYNHDLMRQAKEKLRSLKAAIEGLSPKKSERGRAVLRDFEAGRKRLQEAQQAVQSLEQEDEEERQKKEQREELAAKESQAQAQKKQAEQDAQRAETAAKSAEARAEEAREAARKDQRTAEAAQKSQDEAEAKRDAEEQSRKWLESQRRRPDDDDDDFGKVIGAAAGLALPLIFR